MLRNRAVRTSLGLITREIVLEKGDFIQRISPFWCAGSLKKLHRISHGRPEKQFTGGM